MEWTEEKFQPSLDPVGQETDETLALLTPNVMRVARRHFDCAALTGAELEDDGGSKSAYAHWEERIFQVWLFSVVLPSLLSANLNICRVVAVSEGEEFMPILLICWPDR